MCVAPDVEPDSIVVTTAELNVAFMTYNEHPLLEYERAPTIRFYDNNSTFSTQKHIYLQLRAIEQGRVILNDFFGLGLTQKIFSVFIQRHTP